MISLTYDLHLHSCLSPCGDADMTPGNIVAMSALKGLDVIALTDHNSSRNCPAILEIAKDFDITVLPGMELTTAEEVHVVCLFPTLELAMAADTYVYQHLMAFPNNEAIFGAQHICDASDQIIDSVPNLLINSTSITFDEVYDFVSKYHGLMMPAHIDKGSNSLLSNLGFVPPDSQFTCVEVKDMGRLHHLQQTNPYLNDCHILCSSDAHYLEDIHEPYYSLTAKSKRPEDILRALSLSVSDL